MNARRFARSTTNQCFPCTRSGHLIVVTTVVVVAVAVDVVADSIVENLLFVVDVDIVETAVFDLVVVIVFVEHFVAVGVVVVH